MVWRASHIHKKQSCLKVGKRQQSLRKPSLAQKGQGDQELLRATNIKMDYS
jgi:hypothetical protein